MTHDLSLSHRLNKSSHSLIVFGGVMRQGLHTSRHLEQGLDALVLRLTQQPLRHTKGRRGVGGNTPCKR
jgi:hypothetical protein